MLTSIVYVPPGVIGAGPKFASSLLEGDMMVVKERDDALPNRDALFQILFVRLFV